MIKIKIINITTASTEPSIDDKVSKVSKANIKDNDDVKSAKLTKTNVGISPKANQSFKIRLRPNNDKSIRLFKNLIDYLKSREKEFNRWGIKLRVLKNVVYLNYIEPSCAYWAFRPKGISSIAVYWYNGGPSSVCEASLAVFKSYQNLVDFINYNVKFDKAKERRNE